jgi:hypothetical protein
MGPLVMREAAAPSEFVEDAELPLAADCPLLLDNVEDDEDIEPPVLDADEPMPPPLLLSEDRLVAAACARLL